MDTIARDLAKYPLLVLDGAFGTELARRGFDTNDELWSAKALFEKPELVEAVHRDYYEAGADISTSASYQATVEGFEKKGFTREQAKELIVRSVRLVQQARDAFWQQKEKRVGRPQPLAAASVGPYGAYLADGSEYRGDYGASRAELADFHAERLAILISAGPDILACETLPLLDEARAILDDLRRYPDAGAGSRSRAKMPSTPVVAMPSPTARACSTRRARSRPSASTARRRSTWPTSSATSAPIRQSPSSSTRTRARRTTP